MWNGFRPLGCEVDREGIRSNIALGSQKLTTLQGKMVYGRRKKFSPLVILFVLLGCFLLVQLYWHQPLVEAQEEEAETVHDSTRHLLVLNIRRASRNRNCTPPSIEEFPNPLIPQTARKRGAVLIHFAIAIYMFVALSITCDEYFVPSLERISESLGIQQDVAGATFMAAGSSAPELATAVIGVFVAQDDIGISGVIGSAVFNVMFVIGSCALFSGSVIYISWWPLTRDCLCYLIAIFALLFTIIDEQVTWYESAILLLLYCSYIVLMYFNPRIEARLSQFNIPVPETARRMGNIEHERLIPYKSLDEEAGLPLDKQLSYQQEEPIMKHDRSSSVRMPEQIKKPEEDDLLHVKPWYSYTIIPIEMLCKYTIPDCKEEKPQRFYVAAFFVSLVWISLFSYLMVWMITVIGFTLGIPDTVMGLTFIAAGASIPDILSSLAVARDGYGDMAVANAIGSNVFDILVCLGLPWFLQTAFVRPGSIVKIISKGMVYSTISLFSTIVFLVAATHLNQWKLDRKYGFALIIWYLFFMLVASMYELNVFGNFNPPECPSTY